MIISQCPRHPLNDTEKVMCRHCIQQYQKLQIGKVKEVSQFCPIQLFGDSRSQLSALIALLKTPQNNFVFRMNGERVSDIILVSQLERYK